MNIIESMSMNDVFWKGYAAYQNGKCAADNPYYSEDAEWEHWNNGFWQAAQDD